ncbi:MAG: NusG domain II-containing protein [Eubacteriales bacterium]|nr:NusG domain II-containing protein [Eubacteriales bacterium]
MKNNMTKADVILIFGVFVLSVLLAAGFFWYGRGTASVVVIEQDGREIMRLPLQENTVRIPCENGYNIVMVTERGVSVKEADCPDRICVRQGEITGGGQSIVCLPHKLVVRLVSEDGEELDAMTN